MKNTTSLLLAGVLSCGLAAQEERVVASPRPDVMTMSLAASVNAADSTIMIKVGNAHTNGLVAVLYGLETDAYEDVGFGIIRELDVLGVLTWGEASHGSLTAQIPYDGRFSAGLSFRLQAFSLALTDADAMKFGPVLGSHSILVTLPDGPADDSDDGAADH